MHVLWNSPASFVFTCRSIHILYVFSGECTETRDEADETPPNDSKLRLPVLDESPVVILRSNAFADFGFRLNCLFDSEGRLCGNQDDTFMIVLVK